MSGHEGLLQSQMHLMSLKICKYVHNHAYLGKIGLNWLSHLVLQLFCTLIGRRTIFEFLILRQTLVSLR